MRVPRFLVFFVQILLASVSLAAEAAPAPAILPQSFAGWQIAKPAQTSKDPTSADSANASLLKEYGFTDLASATYIREDGRKLTIKAARFQDASGAYGAFTFYQMPQMQAQQIGDDGASLNERVLFYRGNLLVDASFERLSAMSAAELRALASALPRPAGTSASLPVLMGYLPRQSSSIKYIVGPIGLEKNSAPLSAQYVDFSRGAEVVLAESNITGSTATFMLVGYPTPQIATAQLRAVESAQQEHWLLEPLFARRTGPLMVVVSGSISKREAESLLSTVNYDADVTWNERTPTRRDNAANLIVGVILLAAIICGLSVLTGVAFGGFRVVVKRLLPGRVFDRPDRMEIIALHLSDRVPEPSESSVSHSIEAG